MNIFNKIIGVLKGGGAREDLTRAPQKISKKLKYSRQDALRKNNHMRRKIISPDEN